MKESKIGKFLFTATDVYKILTKYQIGRFIRRGLLIPVRALRRESREPTSGHFGPAMYVGFFYRLKQVTTSLSQD